MKKFIIFIIAVFSMISCTKPDRIDHEDYNNIYVWEYNLNGDSCLHTYSKPIYITTIVVDKRHYSRRRGRTRRHYYIVDCANIKTGVVSDEYNRLLYNNVNIGDTVIFREFFYPQHRKIISSIKAKNE